MVALPFPDPAVPYVLRAIQPHRLLVFLDRYREYFRGRDLELPALDSPGPLPYDRLTAVLLSPGADTPGPLTDGLSCVVGLGTPELMPAVLAAAREGGAALGGDDLTPADLAVQLWLQAPHLGERVLAEQSLGTPREFEFFRTAGPRVAHHPVTDPVIEALEGELGAWFAEHLLGRPVRVFHYPRTGGLGFLVRHGEPFRREHGSCDTGAAGVAYRPLTHDAVVYDLRTGQLRVHAGTPEQRDFYRRALGRHLFGRDEHFAAWAKYTLRPLYDLGPEALRCADVADLERVTLCGLDGRRVGAHGEHESIRSDDVFATLRDHGRALASLPDLVRATFEVRLRDVGRAGRVTIIPPNRALFDRDRDVGPVEEWLSNRGFLNATDDRTAPPRLVRA